MTITEDAAALLDRCRREAKDLGSRVVGQEHVLLAIGTAEGTLAVATLDALGIRAQEMRERLTLWLSMSASGETWPLPTPRLLKAGEEADSEAAERGRATTTADLVLGIVRARVGVGYELLRAEGVTIDRARAALDGVPVPHQELDRTLDGSAAALLRAPV